MRWFLAALILLTMTVAGCGAKPAPTTQVIPLTEVTPALLEVVKKRQPTVKFDSARRIQMNGEEVFEIRGKLPNGGGRRGWGGCLA